MSKTKYVFLGQNGPSSETFIYSKNPPDDIVANASHFSLFEYGKSHGEQVKLFKAWHSWLMPRPFSSEKSCALDNKNELVTALIQRLCRNLNVSLSSARLFQKVLNDEEIKFILPMPPELLKSIDELGIKIEFEQSTFHWKKTCRRLLIDSIKANVISMAGIVTDYWALPRKPKTQPPDTFWLGLLNTDFGDNPKKIGITGFIQAKRLPFLKDSRSTFVVSATGGPQQQKVDNITIGRNPFRCQGRPAPRLTDLFKGLAQQLRLIGNNIYSFSRGRWWDLVLAPDVAHLPRVGLWLRDVRPKYIAWSNILDKDILWSLWRKKFGFQTWHIFYSTFCSEPNLKNEATHTEIPEYYFMLADRFAVWGREQAAWLKSIGYSSERVIEAGPIVYSGYPPDIPYSKSETGPIKVAIFDVVPLLEKTLVAHGRGYHYLSYKTMRAFVEKTYETLTEIYGSDGFEFILKPKRLSPGDQKRYWDFLNELKLQKNVTILEPELSPLFVVKDADLVISIPFTSPSYIAQYYGVPSCFFDPDGVIASRAHTGDTPPLLSNISELKTWLKQNHASKRVDACQTRSSELEF